MKNKYNAKKTIYNGIKFDSQLEERIYRAIMQLKDEGIVVFVALQVPSELQEKYENIDGKKIRSINYKCDFVVHDKNGKEFVIDAKGMLTPVFKLKKKLFEYKYNKIIHTVSSMKAVRELIKGSEVVPKKSKK